MTDPSPWQHRPQYQPQHHVPYYEGPPAATFEPPHPMLARRRSRAPYVAVGVLGVAAIVVAAVAVARPGHSGSTPRAASPVAQPARAHTSAPTPAPAPAGDPSAPSLDHTAPEKLLVDFEDATAPVCNAGKDIAAKVGRTFKCVEGAKTWTVRITEVQADGGVRYELVD